MGYTGLDKTAKILLIYYHRKQKIRGRHLDRFGKVFFNDLIPPIISPPFLLETNAEICSGHGIKFSGLAYGSSSHLSCALKLFLLIFSQPCPCSCAQFMNSSLCLSIPGCLISLYLLMPAKMLLVCHMVLRGAGVVTNTIFLACCSLTDVSVVLQLFSVKAYSASIPLL